MKNPEIISRPSAPELIELVTEWLLEKALASTADFRLCLAGGSTPRELYKQLAKPPTAALFPWHRTHIFFGDERFVSHASPESNYQMACQTLLNHVPIPPSQIHPIPFTKTPEESARLYEKTLQSQKGNPPLFSVTLLGLGEDGHTASLFPNTSILNEKNAWVSTVIGAKPEPRISLTYQTLENSETVAFLVIGENKHSVARKVLKEKDINLPATQLSPRHNYIWFIAPQL